MRSAAPNTPLDRPDLEPLLRGTKVGRFVLTGLLGRGGMGEVYQAYDPELDRRVAIKLLRAASDRSDTTIEARASLVREAQAIAKVSHPNVVVVYDVGTFEGRVFIAMEFVEGHTLGYWLLAEKRTTSQILEVFGAAGRGLAAAHQKELVHRDFKPENVMVAANGQVRVMDFGLARVSAGASETTNPRAIALTPDSTFDDPFSTRVLSEAAPTGDGTGNVPAGISGLTTDGAIMGTPAYMSPEQFRGAPANASSDQFSFCVALYEALYGERPFDATTIRELTINVIEGKVRRAPADSHVPASIRRALLRGLNPEQSARFPSMGSLLLVLGFDQTPSGQHRFVIGAAAKLAGVWEAPEGDRPVETEAKAEIRRSFLATEKPYAVATFDLVRRILDRFARRWTDLYVDACQATHVRGEQSTEVLDLRVAALGEALEDLRALCREFAQSTPEMIENAVNAANALGTLERCADVKLLRAIVRPPEDPAKRVAVEHLQLRLSEVRALGRVGRVADALKASIVLEADARRIGYSPLLAEVLFLCGMMHFEVSDIEAATRILEDAAWTAELCRHDEVAAQAAASLIFLTGHVQSRFDAGEIWARHAETVLTRIGGHELIRGWLFNNRGAMRATQGRLADAIADVHLAIADKQKALGPDDPDVAVSVANAAIYLDELGETQRAADYGERAVKIIGRTLGLDHPKAAVTLTNYAEILNRLGRFAEALAPARRALSVFERETDPDGLYVTYPLAALGASYMGSGDFALAVPPFERAVRIREAKENVPAKLAEVHFGLARALSAAGDGGPRASDLARRAHLEYLQAPVTPAIQRDLREMERWLAEHAAS